MVKVFFLLTSLVLFSTEALSQGEVRFVESGGGANYVGFKAPAAIAASKLWTLPATDGSNNSCLATDSAGTLNWTVAAGGDLKADGTVAMTAPLRLADGTLAAPSFAFSAGTGQGFRYLSSTEISYVSSGVDRWVLSATGYGKVGAAGAWVLFSTSSVSAPTFSFSNDLDMGVYHPADDKIGLVTSGAERISVDSTGVGVGTSTPAAALDINGEIRLKKNASAPVVCAAAQEGKISLTSNYTLCVCNGAGAAWVRLDDGGTACTW